MDISRIRNHLLPYFGEMRMSDIEKRDVVQLINDQLPSYKEYFKELKHNTLKKNNKCSKCYV